MTIFRRNRRKDHKFIASAAMFGFCMSRIVTCTMRLVWATRPTNAGVAIAAQIFTNAGVLIVYVVVFIMVQRLLRATRPRLGWNPLLRRSSKLLYALLAVSILLVIGLTVTSFYTLDPNIRSAALYIQRAAITYMLLFNVLAAAMWLLSVLPHSKLDSENFGSGSLASKQIVLGVALFFVLFIAGFRAGTTWAPSRPASDPAWYHHKACFYIFNFTFEITVICLFLATRFDRLFWVPNKSDKPGDYSRRNNDEEEDDIHEGNIKQKPKQ